MNVLMMVFTLLMTLAIFTYGRLHSFIHFSNVKAEFQHYHLSQQERWRSEMHTLYENTSGSETQPKKPKDADEAKKEETQPKSKLHSRIGCAAFVNKEKLEPYQFQQLKELFKKQIEFLYGKQDFYIKMREKRPDFVEEILNRLMEILDRSLNQSKVKKAVDISTVNLEDEELQLVLYKMLKGSRDKKHLVDEYEIEKGYLSLAHFIDLEKYEKKVSLYLAQGETLMALYNNKETVAAIIKEREEIFKEVRKDKDRCKEAALRLRALFGGLSIFGADEETIICFDVTTTNPINYR